MDVKSPLNLAEPCQHDGHQEGLLCFDQHQCAWEHIPDQRHHLCQCVSAPARPQEPGRDLTHLPFCLKPKISFCTNFIWRGDWRYAVTQVGDTVFSKMDQAWACILEIQAFFPRALYTSCCFIAFKRNLDFSCFLIFPIVFKICSFVSVLMCGIKTSALAAFLCPGCSEGLQPLCKLQMCVSLLSCFVLMRKQVCELRTNPWSIIYVCT